MTRIALLRHFPTDWNGEGRLQGRIDRPLTDEARATLAGLALPPPWDTARLVASTLSRAAETASILAAAHDRSTTEIRLDPRLVEVSWGAWEGLARDEMPVDAATGRPAAFALGWECRPPGGESMTDAVARARPALAEIAAGRETTLVVTHKALMRAILREASDPTLDVDAVEIGRGRLYPLILDAEGRPYAPEPPARLVPRKGRRA